MSNIVHDLLGSSRAVASGQLFSQIQQDFMKLGIFLGAAYRYTCFRRLTPLAIFIMPPSHKRQPLPPSPPLPPIASITAP